ncbi:MAG: DUF3551 domain-containing protein [Xanthobacteraceae bacterium]
MWSTAAAAVVISAASFIGSVQPSQAQITYPWCAHYGGRDGGGGVSCGSVTYAQCMATVSGQQGYCDRNPWYQEPPAPALTRSKKRLPS